jgi:hypothetical protein
MKFTKLIYISRIIDNKCTVIILPILVVIYYSFFQNEI